MDATHEYEEWRPVVGYEGLYEVSDLGRVKSLPRMTPTRWGTSRFHPGGLLSVRSSPTTGYVRTTLVDARRGMKRYANVHSLVLEAFVGPRPNGMECCHRDGDRGNAALSNLRWDTRSANTKDAVAHGTNAHARKVRCPQGHEYTRVQYNDGRGWRRICKPCTAARAKRRNQAKSNAA